MKTTLLIVIFLACLALADELEYRDHLNRYEACIDRNMAYIYTDLDITGLTRQCDRDPGFNYRGKP